jgi:hypothetical protein
MAVHLKATSIVVHAIANAQRMATCIERQFQNVADKDGTLMRSGLESLSEAITKMEIGQQISGM